MVTDKLLQEIFAKYHTIAVYGMSRTPGKPARYVPAFLISKGYHIIPVNPHAEEILGRKSYPSLAEIPGDIDILAVFRPSEEAPKVVQEALERKKARGDIAVIWLQEGIVSEEAQKLAEDAGIIFIQDRCMRKEFKRLFPES